MSFHRNLQNKTSFAGILHRSHFAVKLYNLDTIDHLAEHLEYSYIRHQMVSSIVHRCF